MSLLEEAAALGIRGFIREDELEKLAELAKGREVLEIGSYWGLSAWAMAHTASHVFCVDNFLADDGQSHPPGELTTFATFKTNVEKLGNVSWLIATSEDASLFVERDFDMVFIDGSHTYEDVKGDIERWWPHVRTGGVMVLHDYGHTSFGGVVRAADEIFGPAPSDTVVWTLRWITKQT